MVYNILIKFKSFRHVKTVRDSGGKSEMKNDYELKEIDFELIFIVDTRCVRLMIVSSAIFFIYFFLL